MDFNQAANDVQRKGDAEFHADIDKLVSESEHIRMELMRAYELRGMVSTTAMILFVCLGAAGFGWYLFFEGRPEMAFLSMIAAVIVPVMVTGWAEGPLKRYKQDYKTRFMPKMADALGGFRFYPQRGISRKLIQKTGILPAHETYKAEDCFMGTYDGVKVLFSEARLYRGKQLIDPVFDGVFVLLETPNDTIRGHSILTSDHAMIGRYASQRWKQLSPVPLTHDRNIHIDFKLFSSKRHHGETLDQERLLQELAEASDVFDKAPITLVAFGKKYVFISIPYKHNMFEPSNIHIPIKTKQHAIQCKREIEQILELIDVCDIFRR